ncbi:MAG: methylated-DNA--[protein]-cysteine S-methyltransferase [Halieaceae bacterium]|jgi:methylated-DNA-[protein]-cysteine S-methyltransferase|nr:methylated-DNA--[protein]-cysteine S-methyltransferase [Halieaceae bacterium]
MNYQYLDTPIGTLRLVSSGSYLLRIEFPDQHGDTGQDIESMDTVLESSMRQLQAYFSGSRKRFDLPLGAGGTDFQRSVWTALVSIPYGEVRSYRDIAQTIGKPSAVRAVGAANGRNPLPIVVPCHRVIGSNGSLTGFAGGLQAKSMLLSLEGVPLP